jgi:hypothetical protein
LFGREAGEFHFVGGSGSGAARIEFVVELGTLGVETEVVEVEMAPAAGAFVNEANLNFFAEVIFKIDCDGTQAFGVKAGGLEKGFAGVRADDFDARGGAGAAVHEEAGPGLFHFEGDGGQGALRGVAVAFVGANPILAGVLALHVVAAHVDGVAFEGLAFEGFAGGGPVRECAGFEIEIERLAIGAGGQGARTFGSDGDGGSGQ